MNRNSYMSKNELLSTIKMGLLAGEASAEAEITSYKPWRQKLRTIATLAKQIVNDRFACLDGKQLLSVMRRWKGSEVRLYTTDEFRMHPDQAVEDQIVLNTDDFYDLASMANSWCQQCPQGKCVKNCCNRELFHRLAIPVARDNVKPGQCEFRVDDEVVVTPPPTEGVVVYDKLREVRRDERL